MSRFSDACGSTLGKWFGASALVLAAITVTTIGDSPEPAAAPETAADAPCLSSPANNYCAPTDNDDVARIIRREERDGYRCSEKPALTDHIVFEYRDYGRRVAVLTFDAAIRSGKGGLGWVQSYCVKPGAA